MEFYYPGDAEIYLKYGKLPDHEWLLFILNLGLDELDELDLKSSLKLECVETLTPGGFWKKVIFSENLVKIPLVPMSPLILKIKETSSQ